jgi:hypothetical protein
MLAVGMKLGQLHDVKQQAGLVSAVKLCKPRHVCNGKPMEMTSKVVLFLE